MYLYRVSASEYSINVEVGIYDPDAWDGKGGMKFGFTADVAAWADKPGRAGVNQGSIGSHVPADALMRIDCYQQAADIAQLINELVTADNDTDFVAVGNWLTANLPTEPVETPFRNAAWRTEVVA